MNDRSKRLRFAAWIVAAAGAGGGQIAWLGYMSLVSRSRTGWRFEAGYVAVLSCVAALIGLLSTTPADAIRLPRWISELVIALVVMGLSLPVKQYLPAMIARLIFLIPALILLRAHRKSAWWAAVIAWFPILH